MVKIYHAKIPAVGTVTAFWEDNVVRFPFKVYHESTEYVLEWGHWLIYFLPIA